MIDLTHLQHLLPDTVLSWRDLAACRQADPMIFFPSDQDASGRRYTKASAAKAVCAECVVRVECLEYAMESRQPEGVWGGLTRSERVTERERRVRARRQADPEEHAAWLARRRLKRAALARRRSKRAALKGGSGGLKSGGD